MNRRINKIFFFSFFSGAPPPPISICFSYKKQWYDILTNVWQCLSTIFKKKKNSAVMSSWKTSMNFLPQEVNAFSLRVIMPILLFFKKYFDTNRLSH